MAWSQAQQVALIAAVIAVALMAGEGLVAPAHAAPTRAATPAHRASREPSCSRRDDGRSALAKEAALQ